MKWIVIAALLGVGGYVAWKKLGGEPSPPPAAEKDATPGADMKNRIDNLSGAAPE